MSMKKAFDQTIRDLKREVNKKVLKVPTIEQKVLDASSNEPWGPHGSLLADIAHATKNYHEHQMIMAVIWKRINDTGKNWRHVYKALTVLEYLVAHGSERVIDDIREHSYQISTLSDFQYIDSSGRDQGNNVRRKSQSLVLLVSDKERIQEVRQKAAANREKFCSTSAVGGLYQPGSGGYGDDRYENRYSGREDDYYGYGRDKELGYRDERYGRYEDSYYREGDRYGRESEECYGRDIYRDDDFRGRSRSVDDYGQRSRSSEADIGHAYDDDDRHLARESSFQPIDHPHGGRPLERKYSEQNLGAPPIYEEAVEDSQSPAFSERDGETPVGSAPQSSSPAASDNSAPQSSPSTKMAPQSSSPIASASPSQATAEHGVFSHPKTEVNGFDEFDPRGSASVALHSSNNAEVDLFGSLSDVFSSNPSAIMPASSRTTDLESDATKTGSDATFSAATSRNNTWNQAFEDPFGESPFKAIPSDDTPTQAQDFSHMPTFHPDMKTEHTQTAAQKTATNVELTDPLTGIDFDAPDIPQPQSPSIPQYTSHEVQLLEDNDILAGILPPSGPAPSSQTSFPVSTDMFSASSAQTTLSGAPGLPPAISSQAAFSSLTNQTSAGCSMPQSSPYQQIEAQNMSVPSALIHQTFHPHPTQPMVLKSNVGHQAQMGPSNNQDSDFLGDLFPQAGLINPSLSQSVSSSSAGPFAIVPQQPSKEREKFEPKSAVWADTLRRGLVDFNISGPKCNPMSDIGVDFESLNRKEKRMEKTSATPATSNVVMGKAMGSGSGMGRAGAGAIRSPSNPMLGSGMGIGMGMGTGGAPGAGMGMRIGGYGSMNQQPMAMGVGSYGLNNQQPMSMGMGMNTGRMNMGQGVQMQPPNGLAPGSNTGNYNPMMGRGGYPQQPFGGGYR